MSFGKKWRKWEFRERLNDFDNCDISDDFGLLGIYILAISPNLDIEPSHEAIEVVYIGMSRNVLARLERSHSAVKKIKKDLGLKKLYFAEFNTGDDNSNLESDEGKVSVAYLHYLERKMIWEYARKHKKLPKYNIE